MDKKLKKVLKQARLNEDTISMILGSIVLVVVGVLIYNYFTSINKGEITSDATQEIAAPTPGVVEVVEEDGKKFAKGLPTTYEVKQGDSLWQIAEDYYSSGYNWVDIAKENGLKNANQIAVGQKLSLPNAELKTATVAQKATIDGNKYLTIKGDHLWNIAVRAYGDGYSWTKIYQANLDKIGNNPNQLEKGIELTIPR